MTSRAVPPIAAPPSGLAEQVEPGRSSMLAALRYRDFRLFWFGWTISNVGTWMQMFGQGWLVVQLAIRDGTPQLAPLYLGLVGLARAIPGLTLGLVGGAIADRTDRRQLLLVTQTTAGFLAFLLATLTHTGTVTILAVILIAAASSSVFAFDAPTRQSMVPRLVPRTHLMSAIGLNQAAFNGPQIIGPALGGILIGVIDIAGLFYVNALSYVAIVVSLLLMRPVPVDADRAPQNVLQSVREGVRYMRRDPVIKWVIVLTATMAFFARPYVFLLPAVAANVLGVGATELSLLMTSTGVGALVGSLLVANLGAVLQRGRLLLLFTALSGASLMAFTLQRGMVGAIVAALCVGLATIGFNGLVNTILQTSAPDRLLGRVMSAFSMVFMGLMPLGQLTLGATGSLVGVDTVLFVGGAIVLGGSAWATLRLSWIRGLLSTRGPHAHPHVATARAE